MWTPFQTLNRTQTAMNQKTAQCACTDKPSFDRGFFMKIFDRLRKRQEDLNENVVVTKSSLGLSYEMMDRLSRRQNIVSFE